jgi:Rrf2 family protein
MSMRNSPSVANYTVLSKTAEYALRALLVLARHGVGRHLPADVIADATGTPGNYLSKTLYALGKAGLVRGSRGPTGGFALAVDPGSLTIAGIASVFSEPPAAPRCLLGTGLCDASRPCAAHYHWKRVLTAAREPLRSTTIADLLADIGDDPSPYPTNAGAAGAT